ncbi:MAG: hypothetical protein GX818_08260 [Tissierellia bacterium]|nr:hypothetical protein [Tissierellia bacterium]
MKKRVIALTLTALLALSSTSAFAATTNCTTVNYNNLFKNYTGKYANVKNQFKVRVNGKEINLNSVDWKTVLKQYTPAEKPVTQVQKPAAPVEKPATPAPAPATPAPTPVEKPAAPIEKNDTTVSSSNLTYEQKVVELVNVERQKAGLSTLKMDSAISNVARAKSKDMAVNNYFAHQSPTYGSAGDMLRQFGISWSAWGENIASGQRTPEIVVNAWMNSPGHRANILSNNFSKIGVGYVTNSNGTPYWTQIFTN